MDTDSPALRGLSPSEMASFESLKHGKTEERIAAASTLRRAIAGSPEAPALEIWYAAKDMIEPEKPSALRTAGWELLCQCVLHGPPTDLEKKEYFQTMTASTTPEDLHLLLTALAHLTENGRKINGIDYQFIPLLSGWLHRICEVRHERQESRASKTSHKVGTIAEEKNIAQIFGFIMDAIKYNSNVAGEAAIDGLIDGLLGLCMTSSLKDELRSCIAVLDRIVTFAYIPPERLKGCVQVLSSIYCLVPSLHKDAWNTLSMLCRSHNGQSTVRILLDILRNTPSDGTDEMALNRDLRGALSVLRKLLSKSAEKGYPSVPFALLVDGLASTVKMSNSFKAHVEILKLVNLLFEPGDGAMVHPIAVDEDWTVILDVASKCSERGVVPSLVFDSNVPSRTFQSPSSSTSSLSGLSSRDEQEKPEEVIGGEVIRLVRRLEWLMARSGPQLFIPRQTIIEFFTTVHSLLPDSPACAVLDYFQEFRCCSPSDPQWEDNLKFVVEAVFANSERTSDTRVRALHTVMDAYEITDLVHDESYEFLPDIVRTILLDISEETDVRVLEAVVSLMVSIAATSDMDLFNYIVDTLRGIVIGKRLRSPISPMSTHSPGSPGSPVKPSSKPAPTQSASNVVTAGYAKLFMWLMNTDSEKSIKMFDFLVNIAKSAHCETDARLTAMKLLCRLRSDWANRIFVTNDLETDSLAAVLFRTKASLMRRQTESSIQSARLSRGDSGAGPTARRSRGVSISQSQQHERGLPVRTASNSTHPGTQQQSHQLWGLPDTHAITAEAPSTVSPLLVSYVDESKAKDDEDGVELKPLNLAGWLDTILYLFQHGCDWEVYSYVLVHLPSQLSNHTIFRSAIPQVQELRKVICEQLQKSTFSEPPFSSGLRKADVAICLLHNLTMILSYHKHFQKQEEDDIVWTFVHSIATYQGSAKTCIHALSVCCHELPLSTSKLLVQMLQKMAQIITQPQVAMHILEFLSGLCRMQHLYVNFREEEYRIVFGIAFRYLQYVRDKKKSQRNSLAHTSSEPPPASLASSGATVVPDPSGMRPTATDDLPQYVYTLAYHVITYWFLALKLPDRASHVGWIAKNLFTDVENAHGEEQAIVTMDFLRRVAFSDAGESAEDPLFTPEQLGEIIERRWVIANSVVTIKQATASGWAQITKRQPSGTSSYMVRELFKTTPHHQIGNFDTTPTNSGSDTGNHVLPSQLLVQLLTPIPQTVEVFKPILLPDEDAVDRTIRLFDMTSTVDGHKIGVIYIGEGQEKEEEILANVSGSVDYIEFLNGLGSLTKLKGATFNTQGLDKEYGSDGDYTFCWRDRVSEIVFHVTTQMPTNLVRDPQCVNKKKHIGNDYVNIIFNDSGLPFRFNTFASDFNYVNIVITPESRATFLASRDRDRNESNSPFYRVKVMGKAGFPEISPASETKMVSLKALPGFVRQLAVNASVFSHVWATREHGEHVSSWRDRLRTIKRMREKYGQKAAPPSSSVPSPSSPPPPPLLGGGVSAAGEISGAPPVRPMRDSLNNFRRSSVATFLTSTSTSEQTSHRSSMMSTTTAADTEIAASGGGLEAIVDALDFSRWA